MFKHKAAWFSNSVKTDVGSFWVSQGGVLSDWKTAEYLFSNDALCPDTKRIHKSDEYIKNRATVFHSAYLSTCKRHRSAKSVLLGHYVLPPLSVQKAVKEIHGKFIWEKDQPFGGESQENSPKETSAIQLCGGRSSMQKKEISQENDISTCPTRENPVCCEAQFYPVNNMVSGYVHVDQLKKYTGELHDFLPHQSGCQISRLKSSRLQQKQMQ